MVVGIMIATEYHLASPATKFISQTDPQRFSLFIFQLTKSQGI
jgi:hypothetical protein